MNTKWWAVALCGLIGLAAWGVCSAPIASADFIPGKGTPRCRNCGRALVGVSGATDPLIWLRPSRGSAARPCCVPPPPPLQFDADGNPIIPAPGSDPAAAAQPGAVGADGQPIAAPAAADASGPATSGAALGQRTSSANSIPSIMAGDLSPIYGAKLRGPVNPPPPPAGGGVRPRGTGALALVRGFKIADNQTPRPVDRCFFTYNFFDYVNQSVNERFEIPIHRIRAYRALLGFEKTFWDDQASIGFRLPINTLTADSVGEPATPTRTALGDFGLYTKFIIFEDTERQELLSGGLAMVFPTGPRVFADAPYIASLHNFELQPYLGYQRNWGRFFLMGFEAINVPTAVHDVTVLYNDWAIGYRVYEAQDPQALLRAVTTNFECHVNIPLNNRDVFNPNNVVGTADIVNLTYGVNFQLGSRTLASFGLVTPVTGPRPFSLEALAILNVFSF
ncbi:MAG: hypothetical protein SFX72_21820 [Isosphaeraceae bacterium]|nr:hypothetical protein [Isosphaeraceae bacterium]